MNYSVPHSPFAAVRGLAIAFLALTASTGVLLPRLRAQIVADGATATLANVTNTIIGTVTVGTNGAFTRLTLADNALLTNSAHGLIGRNATAQSNEIHLVSSSARWLMGGSLFVGSNGALSTLLVSNGATVLAGGSGTIGHGGDFSGSARSNSVTVSGAGSMLSNGLELVVGELAAANRLEVNNGGRVLSSNAFVGRSLFSPSNSVVVTGAGSVWSNRADLSIGGAGAGNLLVVSNGGWVVNSNGQLGNGLGVGNVALVTGLNSTWSNRADLSVGNGGRGNQLVVSDGALVVDNNGVLGNSVTSSNNLALVTGAGSLWSNRADLVVGASGGNNRLVVSNGATVHASIGELGSTAASGTNEVVVTGAGSAWRTEEGVLVGRSGAGNRLRIADGGSVSSASGFIGHSAANNEAILTGPGAAWTNQLDFYVGFSGSGNRLTISNGATLHAKDSSYLGYNPGSDGNTATITGPGSVWRSADRLIVGDFGRSNRLTANAGAALIVGGHGALGVTSGSSNNSMIVAMPGTSLTVASNFHVGSNGTFNLLQLATGASAGIGGRTYVGSGTNGNNNTLDVSNAGSVWTSQNDYLIGGGGPGRNLLLVRNGGVARGFSDGYVGLGGPLNEVIVRDPGSLWDLPLGTLSVGVYDGGNLMTVRDGGVARSASGELGRFTFGSNALVTVTGAGSLWQLTGALSVGASGPRHRLVIDSGGAVVTSSGVFVGAQPTSIQNQVTVSGGVLQATNPSRSAVLDVRRGTNVFNAGLIDVDRLLLTNTLGLFEFNGGTLITRAASISNNASFVVGASGIAPATWDVRAGPSNHVVASHLYVGLNSSFNQLFITNGALLTNLLSFNVGASGSSNVATISGPGSRGASGGGIEVSGGSFNRLVVSDRGSLIGRGTASIGALFSGASNQIVVTGPGSVWNQLGNVEFNGRGNQLLVTDGGLLVCSNAYEGFFGSGSNLALVAGPGSVMNCLETLGVGSSGRGNRLQISNGGLVTVGTSLAVGSGTSSSNNLVLVDNGTLRVTNLAGTGLLEVRRGTNLLNAGLIEADILRMTNGLQSRFEINGGTVSVKSSRVSIGNPLFLGNGVGPATFILAGNGTHDFSGTLGLFVSSNATLTGNGSLIGPLQVRPGGQLVPGASVGKISMSIPPFLQGATIMEISKNSAALTNDQIQVTGTLTYGGTLTVSQVGPTALAAGDSFPLFSATAYAGAFASINLPPLAPPLFWKNHLLVNGSLEVAAPPAISLSAGPHTQRFDTLATNGAANPWRDNVTLPGWYAGKSVAPTNITTYRASNGSENAGALYSFGVAASTERALGSIASDSVGSISYGVGFTNDTGASVSNFVLSYTGEQWRDSSSANTNTLTFWYRVSATALTNPEPGVLTNWTAHASLDFASPSVTGAGLGLDGNATTNRRVFVSVALTGLTVPPGQCVFFRWHDVNDASADQGLAVDDLTVAFTSLVRDFGVDVSHFQNESGIPQSSWNQMFDEGKRFVFVKATEGLTGPHDPTMADNVTRATTAGLLAGVYHFAHPENRPTTNGAVLEASNMVVYAGSAIGPGRLRPVLDLERGANLTTAELTDWVIAFSDEIIARRGAGAAPIIYCSQTFANNELDSRLAGYDLWLRTVNSGADPAVDQPPPQGVFTNATGVFTNWAFWQYSATGSFGGLTPLDLNVCHNEYKPLSSFLIPAGLVQLTGMPAFPGGAFAISFSSSPGALFTVLATTNVSLPASLWTVLGAVTEVSPGQFRFTDTNAPAFPMRFYRTLSP